MFILAKIVNNINQLDLYIYCYCQLNKHCVIYKHLLSSWYMFLDIEIHENMKINKLCEKKWVFIKHDFLLLWYSLLKTIDYQSIDFWRIKLIIWNGILCSVKKILFSVKDIKFFNFFVNASTELEVFLFPFTFYICNIFWLFCSFHTWECAIYTRQA